MMLFQTNLWLCSLLSIFSTSIPPSRGQPLDDHQLLIQTKSGLIRGIKSPSGNTRIFRSIPYATPPTGALRWAAPEPVSDWGNHTINATMDPPGCPQLCDLPPHGCPSVLSEDCLFLNIFSPLQASSSSSKLPVMIFIHGGNFKQGYAGGPLYDGVNLVEFANVILVTINYRLGALGQLWSAEAGMSGNYGFLDQKVAMKWVWNNIEFFGGDNARITLFGQSAGAVSVALHMSQRSKEDSKLFQYAIMESEPMGIPLRDTTTWGVLPKYFFNKLNCSYDVVIHKENLELWQCLRSKSMDQILSAQKETEQSLAIELPGHVMDLFLPWTPTVGTDLFPAQPIFMFQHGMLRDIPFIIGTVRDEARSFIYEGYPNGVSKTKAREILALIVGPDDAAHIFVHYPMPRKVDDYRDYLVGIATDGLFNCANRNATSSLLKSGTHSRSSNVFYYHFDHASSFNNKLWGANYTCCYGKYVCHAEELTYVFNPDLSISNASYAEGELSLTHTLQAYWTQFATVGDPQDGGSLNPTKNMPWSPFVQTPTGSEKSIKFQVDDIVLQENQDLDHSKCIFWDSLEYDWIR